MKISLVTSPHLNHSAFLQQLKRSSTEAGNLAQTFVPMGLLSLAGAVGSRAVTLIKDINKYINSNRLPMTASFYDDAAAWLLDEQPDLVAFMTECDSYHHVVRICQAVKSQNQNVLTMLGCVHASMMHRETLVRFPEIDFVMRGEAELAFPDFVDCLKTGASLDAVGNLTYRTGNAVIVNPELPLIKNLDTLPFPDIALVELGKDDSIWVEIGRGCPFQCNFCITAPYWKRKHRIKSAERVIQELEVLISATGRTDFNFTHDLFTTNRIWVLDFCRKLVARGLNITWTCSSRTDTIDDEQIQWLKRAGCRNIYFGIETGTDELQARIDKNLNLQHALNIVTRTINAGIDVTAGFIAGLPYESDVSLKGTLNMALEILKRPRTTVHLFGFGAYRGSSHYERIYPNLEFDQNFLDFPLPEPVHTENGRMMKNNFDIFSRYSRLKSYGGLSVDVIRAAEEFLPLISTLRNLVSHINDNDIGPFDLLVAWSGWVRTHHKKHFQRASNPYQGTIEEFLKFLEHFLGEHQQFTSEMAEFIRWEGLKDALRSHKVARPKIVVKSDAHQETDLLYTNQSAVIADFKHANIFLPGTDTQGAATFVFYFRKNGMAEISQINPVAKTILNLAQKGLHEHEIVQVFHDLAMDMDNENSQAISNAVAQLELRDLLLRQASTDQH
ncbi:MAG: B12-binding domain-containing radical SAM protein [Rhodospirillales bacterium]|nr:B12-binding domain-containing radical SAM protein [Rhodospirillales bacterium]